MKVMLIDDEQPSIDEFSYLLGKYPDIYITAVYQNPFDALKASSDIHPDAVFLDIDMPYMDGLELALRLQEVCAGIIVVFVTAYSRYALDSFKAYPLDYLLKPVKEARLDAAVEHMRQQYRLMHHEHIANRENFHINCFGRFRCFVPGAEIKWGTRRVRELFLYLVGKCGNTASRSEMIQAMFGGVEDKRSANNLYVTLFKLRSLLDSIDPERLQIRLLEVNALYIAPGLCDYTDFMRFAAENAVITVKNAVEAARMLNLYSGGYLEGEVFEWASDIIEVLETEYERIALGLACVHTGAGRLRETENILRVLLSRNPLPEEGHTALLDIYMENGDKHAYAADYLEYARILRKELGEKPPAKYSDYYKEIKKDLNKTDPY